MNEDIKTGLWSKTSKAGKEYYSGKIIINGKEFQVTMFDNKANKKSDKSPDYQLMLKEKEVVQMQPQSIVTNDDGLPF